VKTGKQNKIIKKAISRKCTCIERLYSHNYCCSLSLSVCNPSLVLWILISFSSQLVQRC